MAFQAGCELHFGNLVAKGLLHLLKQALVFFRQLFNGLFLVLAGKVEVAVRDRFKFLFLIILHHLNAEFVNVVGHAQDFIALVAQALHLRQQTNFSSAFAAGIIDVFLVVLHAGNILVERNHLAFRRGVVHQQVFQKLLVCSIFYVCAVLELHTERLEEGFVLLAVILQQVQQFGLDLLFEIGCNQLEMPIVLEHLARNIQRQVGCIDQAADEVEMIRQ